MIEQLRWKCPAYGSMLIEVPAWNTSLTCPACGLASQHNRPLRAVFVCVGCGHSNHADVNAAINIRERGIELAPTGGQRSDCPGLASDCEPGVNQRRGWPHDRRPGESPVFRAERMSSQRLRRGPLALLHQLGRALGAERNLSHTCSLLTHGCFTGPTGIIPAWPPLTPSRFSGERSLGGRPAPRESRSCTGQELREGSVVELVLRSTERLAEGPAQPCAPRPGSGPRPRPD